jgi:hypothetical protein
MVYHEWMGVESPIPSPQLSGGTLLRLPCALLSKEDVIDRPEFLIRTCGADLESVAAHGMEVKRRTR